MKRVRSFSAVSLSASCLIAWSPAFADTITEIATPVAGFAGSQEVSFARFNPSLGFLNDVVLTYTFGGSFTAFLANSNLFAGDGTVSVTDVAVRLSLSGSPLVSEGTILQGSSNYTIAAATSFYDQFFMYTRIYNSYADSTFPLSQGSATTTFQNDFIIGMSPLLQFIGTGYEDRLGYSAYSNGNDITVTGPARNLGPGSAAVTVASFTVTYDYTPSAIPEPASLLILSAGLLGVAGTLQGKRRGQHGRLS